MMAINLEQDFEALVQAGFVRLSQGPQGQECRFLQALTQEVVYNTMVNRRKRNLHQKIGESLEQQYREDPHVVLDLLAYHFSRTKELDKAIRYLYVAGEQATRLCDNELAIDHFKRVLELLQELEAEALIGVDLYQKEWLQAKRLEQTVIRKQCEIMLLTGQYDEVLNLVSETLQEGLPLLEQVRLMYCRGRVLEKRSEYQESRQVYESARELLAEKGHLKEQARLWNAIGWVSRWLNDYSKSEEACQAALELLDQEPDMEQLAYAHNVLGVVHFYQHEWDESLSHYRQSLRIQKQIQDLWGHANSLSNMGNVYFMTNRWQEAVQTFKESLDLREQLGDQAGQATSCNNLGHALQELGQYDQAEAYICRALDIYTQLGHTVEEAVAQCNLGTVAFRRKNWAEALALLQKGIETMEAHKMEAMLPEIYNHRIEIFLAQEQTALAVTQLKENEAIIREYGDPVQKGRIERLWGMVYFQNQAFDQSKHHFQTALKCLQSTGHQKECQALYQALTDLHKHLNSNEAEYWEEMNQNLLDEQQNNPDNSKMNQGALHD